MSSDWIVKKIAKVPQTKSAILIEGLPGIGNVGKVAVDFLVEDWKAKHICSFSSYGMPHSVFVNEDNLVELPTISLYHKKVKGQDVFLLGGDVQPTDELSSYTFCEKVLDVCKEYKVSEIVTLGGVGLQAIPPSPKVYCTANDAAVMKAYKKIKGVDTNLYGVVGPIIGVSGLLLGLAKQRKIQAGALLAETFAHPMYLGVKGSKEVLQILQKRFKIAINVKQLEKEIAELEDELKEGKDAGKGTALQKISSHLKGREQNYIG